MTHKRNSDRRLRTLERWRSLELDEAQAERAVTEESVVRERAAIAALEQEIERNRESARSLMREPRPLSVDELRRIRTYDAWQAGVLGERNIELEAGEARAEQARDRVTHRFRQLSSVERLR